MSESSATHWTTTVHRLGAAPLRLASEALTVPFDALRWSHAGAVRTGLLRRSLIESGRFEQSLTALETALLGPLARRV